MMNLLRAAFLALLAVAVFAGIAFGAYAGYMATNVTPEERFGRAIENRLNTKLIQQDYEIEMPFGSGSQTVSMSAVSDFSDPANPRSKGTYTFTVSDESRKVSADVEFVMPNKKDTYVRYTSLPESGTGLPEGVINQWVKLDTTASELMFDPAGVSSGLNTPEGEILTGQFAGQLRQTILERIKSEQIYTVLGSTDERIGDADTLKYAASLNGNKIAALNEYVAEQLELPVSEKEDRFADGQFNAWVDKATDQIIRIYLEREGGAVTINYKEPAAPLQADAPVDFVNGSTYFDD